MFRKNEEHRQQSSLSAHLGAVALQQGHYAGCQRPEQADEAGVRSSYLRKASLSRWNIQFREKVRDSFLH